MAELVQPQIPTSTASSGVLDQVFGPGGRIDPLARSAIVEEDYVDRDHARAHDAFFTKAFVESPRRSTRIHFFKKRLSTRALRNLDSHASDYLGFTVVRPLRVRKAGRTVLPFTAEPDEIAYITPSGTTTVHVAGIELQVTAPPFMEQDERVSRCATVDLWMATEPIADRLGLSHYSTAEITQFATRFLIGERALPSGGLFSQQMAEALRTMGYDPIEVGFDLSDPLDAWNVLYAYVESGIPPILVLHTGPGAGHVVTAVGHNWSSPVTAALQNSIEWLDGPALQFSRSSSWVPSLIGHDDESGPYVKIKLLNRSDAASIFPHLPRPLLANFFEAPGVPVLIERQLRDAGKVVQYGALLQQILIPNPDRVTLSYQEAERKAARLVKLAYGAFVNSLPPTNFVLRTYLARSDEMKRSIRRSTMHPTARELYAGKGMPRWVWVTEISDMNWMNDPSSDQQLIRGEILIDATSSPWTADFLTFHLIMDQDGLMTTMLPSDGDAEVAMAKHWSFPGEQPYQHLNRHQNTS